MDIKLLGSLSAETGGVSIVPTASKPRQILALLAVCANQVLPVPTLMEEIWGADMPRSAPTTLQTYILQLRRRIAAALGPDSPVGSKDVLVTRYGGYLLGIDPEAVDVHVYDRLVAESRTAADAGDAAAVARLCRRALALWRGPALVDVQTGPTLEVELVRLEESRLGVLERRIDAELQLGMHSHLLAELRALTVRHPLHEGLHAQFMIALYRSGRQWQALETYQALRGRLVDELGVDPSPRLQRLHRTVLGGDPALDHTGGHRGPALGLFAG
ncbi:AfsR/SARP family transcriptional regulator [Streptomyces rimosus]|uniref:AfsR/SARP family transcriptional regulator n=1 Tax=Streptomyces rimosus TaxID=1927 RepID=UPI0004CA2FEE|nr:AfsR/SARP family transcriptional regulator [Streptomyces rimosus]